MVVGLGNPGLAYERSRHNLGFMVIDELSRRLEVREEGKRFNAFYLATRIQGEEAFLLKPLSFMNVSGIPVRDWLTTLNLPPSRLIVVHDDLDLLLGRLKVVEGGGHGGHKGVRSIQEELGSTDFIRVKIGIGPHPAGWDAADYVLAPFGETEGEVVAEMVKRGADAVEVIVGRGVEAAQNRFNVRNLSIVNG